ncbi:MAG: transporter substrate-binding domain-containing protein [Stappiaceae bacterium]
MAKYLILDSSTGAIGFARWLIRGSCQTLLFLLALIIYTPIVFAAQERQTLNGGWDDFPPFSFTDHDRGIPRWTGFDVELLHEISSRAGYVIVADKVIWPLLVNGIKSGQYDIAAQATKTPEREEFAYFSVPYRSETMVLMLPDQHSPRLDVADITDLINVFKEKEFRLGVTRGAAFPNKEMRDFIDNPGYQNAVFRHSPAELVTNLLDGEIDGYLTNRILGAHFIDTMGASDRLQEHSLKIEGELHLMFSRESVSSGVVEKFNEAIESVKSDGTYGRLNAKYALPILVQLSLDSQWFTAVDLVGTIAFAISGLLLAFRYNYDVFGALVLASLPAVGGGVVRDLITNREELSILASPIYIEILVVLVVGGYFALRLAVLLQRSAFGALAADQMERRRVHIGYIVQICDAIGLAAFTVTGVVVALVTQSHPLWIWGPALAAITAAGGGILRDVVRSDPEIPLLKGELYPEIAVLWGLILSVFFIWEARFLNAEDIQIGILLTFFGALVTRLLTIYLGLKSPRFSA